jgi:Mn-dependent DtxR family transcriptional regulator
METKFFYTSQDDLMKDISRLTPQMAVCLELICRLSLNTGFTRLYELTQALGAQQADAVKTVQQLTRMHLLRYEKNGVILLEESGVKLGKELLRQHGVVEDFLRVIGVEQSRLPEEAEKVEYQFSRSTIRRLADFVAFHRENPDVVRRYALFRSTRSHNTE